MASTPGSSVYVDRQSESPHLTDTKEEISALDMPLPDSGVVDLHHEDGRFKSLKRKRRHFSPEQRKEIQLVRAMGACDNCRKRKLKVSYSAFPLFL
jgi:hypothetical protein